MAIYLHHRCKLPNLSCARRMNPWITTGKVDVPNFRQAMYSIAQHLCNSLVPNVNNGEKDIVEAGNSVAPTLAVGDMKYRNMQVTSLLNLKSS